MTEQTLILDYNALSEEIVQMLGNIQTITLATSFENRVTARTMSIVNDGLIIMFQTGGYSEKINQMRQNPDIAFAVGNMQIEATVEILGQPNEQQDFLDRYKVKYPQYHALYTDIPDEILVIATPIKVSLYKYIDGKPCADVLNITKNMAFREVLM